MIYGYDTMVENHNLNQTPKEQFLTFEELWRRSEAVLFDFDGVIADSEPLYRSSWNIVLGRYGHTIPEKVYWKHWAFLGGGLEGEMERTGLKVPDPAEAKERQREIYGEMCRQGRVPIFSGAVEAVETVMDHRLCVVASNTHSDLIEAVAAGRFRRFPQVVGGEGLSPKPSPDIFLKAADVLGVSPSRCMVFEDADKGLRAASAASMSSVLIRNPYNRDLPPGGASCELPGIDSLPGLIRELEC